MRSGERVTCSSSEQHPLKAALPARAPPRPAFPTGAPERNRWGVNPSRAPLPGAHLAATRSAGRGLGRGLGSLAWAALADDSLRAREAAGASRSLWARNIGLGLGPWSEASLLAAPRRAQYRGWGEPSHASFSFCKLWIGEGADETYRTGVLRWAFLIWTVWNEDIGNKLI